VSPEANDGGPPREPWIIVLARDPAGAKSRLAGVLDPGPRTRLVTAMLEDVLDAALAARAGRVAVATESDTVREIARRRGASEIVVAARGTNSAARDALATAARTGAACAVVLPADLPALRADDVGALVEAVGAAAVVIAPDRLGRGTNALALRPPDVMPPGFGEDSYEAHLASARRLALPHRLLARPGLALDIDGPDDLRRALEIAALLGPRSGALLEDLRRHVEMRPPRSMAM
jgi:2-phospho-L-lactate/phosphoenolpyruvate guanylyltransferase